MSTGEDEPSPGLNGRLRPRKSTASTPSSQTKTFRKTDDIKSQERPKRTSTLKVSPNKQDDLSTKCNSSLAPLILCPYCDRKFTTRQTASKHARRIHLSTSKQDNFIKCIYCNHSDAESHAIIKHLVDCHPNQYFACLDCHTRFSSTTELAEHKLNVCEKQKPTYCNKLRQKSATKTKKRTNRSNADSKSDENTQYSNERGFNGIVISCELKPSDIHDATDIEDKITTNLILPPSKTLGNTGMEKNAVIVLDDLQWNKRIPPNFSFHNTDTDQILSRLGVVHRSPRVGESRKDLIRLMDEPNEKFEKCFDTSFYTKVAKNVQENLAKYLDGSFNFNPDREPIKTRKSKTSVVINTAEGFPILLAYEQFSRHLFDGFMPRTVAPKHKWKWDTADSDNKNAVMLLDQPKRDNHVNNCIITLVSSLDIWTQLRMRRKFEEIFKTTPTAKKTEKQNIIGMELKEILESRDIPTSSTHVVKYQTKTAPARQGYELPSYLGLTPTRTKCEVQPAVLSGEWVRPRAYVCCACGEKSSDARTLSTHISSQHPNAQVQHYEIVGETLLSADILKHLYVPPSQMSNRTRPPRGFRDCTKCKKSITLEDLHQHMLDCAGDTPTVRRKCRYRPFGVRRRRPRLPDNTIRKKMRKDIRSRHRQKVHMRPRPRIRTEVGDAETIRKMIADLPAKRNRICSSNILRPRRNLLKSNKTVKLRVSEDKKSNKSHVAKNFNEIKKSRIIKKPHDTDNLSTIDEDDRPLKPSANPTSTGLISNDKEPSTSNGAINKAKKRKLSNKKKSNMPAFTPYHRVRPSDQTNPNFLHGNSVGNTPFYSVPNHDTRANPTIRRPDALYPPMYFPPMPYSYEAELARQYELSKYHYLMEQLRLAALDSEQRQLAIDQPNERIDVHGAGPSNIKHHGNHDNCNQQNGIERSSSEGDNSNQNDNVNPISNTPNQQAIASLTSDPDVNNLILDYIKNTTYPDTNVNILHLREQNRILFEKLAAANKLDKPPISMTPNDSAREDQPLSLHDPVEYREPGRPPSLPNDPTEAAVTDSIHDTPSLPREPKTSAEANRLSFQHDMVENHNFGERSALSNDSIASIEPAKQSAIQNDQEKSATPVSINDKPSLLIEPENAAEPERPPRETGGRPPLPEDIILSLEPDEPPLPNDPTESAVHGNTLRNIESKTEADKLKLNKSRKGINDCIAMLITKKGLIDDPIFSANTSTNQTTGARVFDANSCMSLGSELISHNSVNLTPARVFSRFSLSEHTSSKNDSENRSQLIPTDQYTVGVKTDHLVQHQGAIADNILIAPITTIKHNENKLRSVRSRSSSRSELETISQVAGTQQIDRTPWVKPLSSQSPDPNSNNALPSLLYEEHLKAQLYNHQNATALVQQSTVSQNATALAQQSTVSARRRTRRKPVKKNSMLEEESTFNYRRNSPPAHLSPQRTNAASNDTVAPADSIRHFNTKTKDTNVQLSILAGPAIIETPVRNSPSPRIREEQYKRVLNIMETSSDISHEQTGRTPNNRYSKLPENPVVNGSNEKNLRCHSVESVNSQGNEGLIPQKYRDIANKSPSNQTVSNLQMTPSEDSINVTDIDNNVRYSNEVQCRYSSVATLKTVNQDKREEVQANVDTEHNDVMKATNASCEIQDVPMTRGGKQQQNTESHTPNKERNLERKSNSHVDHSTICSKTFENKYIHPQYNVNKVTSKALDMNIQQHAGLSSGEYCGRSAHQAQQTNSPHINQRNQTKYSPVYDGNRHNESLRPCHKSFNATYPIPVVPYCKNIYRSIPYTPTLPSECDSEEMTPLDLSFDPTVRNKKRISTISDKVQNPDESITPKKNDLDKRPEFESLKKEHTDQLKTIKASNDVFNKNLESLPHRAVILEENENYGTISKKRVEHVLDMADSENMNVYNNKNGSSTFTLNPSASFTKIAMLNRIDQRDLQHPIQSDVENSLHNLNLQKKSSNEGNACKTIEMVDSSKNSTDECLYQNFNCNYINAAHAHTTNQTINYQGINQVRHIVPESNFTTKPYIPYDTSTMTGAMNCVDANTRNGQQLRSDSKTITPLEIKTKNTDDIKNPNDYTDSSMETVANIPKTDILPEKENILIDQDQKTAQKIAMIPKEIIEIINRIPEDTRNKLIDVLPQYVSTPIPLSIISNNGADISPVTKGDVLPHHENKQTSVSLESSRLCVNTVISPSSIVPKKRHSPSQSKGVLNYNESQFTTAMLHPSHVHTLLQISPIEQDATLLNENENFRNNSHTQEAFSVTRRKSIDKDNDDVEINVVDFSDPESINKSNDITNSTGNDFKPPSAARELVLKPSRAKTCNEQTASLRAVRIKTSSARKSLSDEKQMSISYHSFLSPNERELAIPGHNYSPIINRTLTSLKDNDMTLDTNDTMRALNSQNSAGKTGSNNEKKYFDIGCTYQNNVIIDVNKDLVTDRHNSVIQNVSNFESTALQKSTEKTLLLTSFNSNISGDSENRTDEIISISNESMAVLNKFKPILKDGYKSAHETHQIIGQSDQINNKELSAAVPLEITNEDSKCLLYPTMPKSLPFVDCQNASQEHHLPEIYFLNNDRKKQILHTTSSQSHIVKTDLTTSELESLTDIVTENSNKNEVIRDPNLSEIMLSNLLPRPKNDITANTNTISEILSLSKKDKTNEDDSDDEISLAEIKQKHCVEPCVPNVNSSGTDIPKSNTSDVINIEKSDKRKGARKCRKKNVSKNLQIIEVAKFSECKKVPLDITMNSEVDEGQCVDVNKTEIMNSDEVPKNYEFDVNKENNISDFFYKIKDSERSEHIQTEMQSDISVDKNISNDFKDTININLNIGINSQQLEEKGIATSDNKIVVTALQNLDTVDPETNSLEKARQCKGKKKSKIQKGVNDNNVGINSNNTILNSIVDANNDYVESKCEKIDVSAMPSSPLADSVVKFVQELDTENSPKPSQSVYFESDFKLCSEIGDGNFPLRRSRRGKSMYVDNIHKDHNEPAVQVENIDQKAPLTMKRLILSRVEKDNKRMNESIILQKYNNEPKAEILLNEGNEVLNIPSVNDTKDKQTKRKRSPQFSQKSKKTKPSGKYQCEEENPKLIQSGSENKIPIELPNTENKIESNETHQEVMINVTVDNTNNVLEEIRLPDKDIFFDDKLKDSLIHSEDKDPTVSRKRKLHHTIIAEIQPSKSKKTKHHKKRDSSDFDSDDEKGLLETKQQMDHEKLLTSAIINKHTKESNNEPKDLDKLLQHCDVESCDTLQTPSITLENRMTCYSRPIPNRKLRLSTPSVKDRINYDPYDIDFEDMIETTKPASKKKGKIIESSETAKSRQDSQQNTKNAVSPFSKYGYAKHDDSLSVNNESDSDSSKSDVPLQKYVNEKINKNSLKATEVSKTTAKDKIELSTESVGSVNKVENKDITNDECSIVEVPCDEKKTMIQENCDDVVCDGEIDIITNNNISIDQSPHKQQNRQKKPRRTLAVCNNVDDSITVSNELEQRLNSDKFMEKFGFFSERIPRKSNLLASKKISETFHMISNESDDPYFAYKEKSSKKFTQNENIKKSETANDFSTSQDSKMLPCDATNFMVQSAVSKSDFVETNPTNATTYDASGMENSDVDSLTAQSIFESEEVRSLENDIISSLKETADANAAQNNVFGYQNTCKAKTTKDIETNNSILNTEEGSQSQEEGTKSLKKSNKSKPNKEVVYKEKMYPDVEEIDMFEDKFDKIKRKRRSLAVAAKQVQNVVETNTSVKSRKQTDKKKSIKNIKKSTNQNTQVLTKGALKGFDGIKISIPTQDLNMPPNVSPPRHEKKRRKMPSKRRKEISETESSSSETDEKEKCLLERDIYEFKDSEDTELLELRPSTVMDRFRSMNKNKLKLKEKDKAKWDIEKPRERVKEKEKKLESKEKGLLIGEKYKQLNRRQKDKKLGKEKRKYLVCEQQRRVSKEKSIRKQENINLSNTKQTVIQYTCTEGKVDDKSALTETTHDKNGENNKIDHYIAFASTSGFVPGHMDESDYESELSSPEGEFIFYMSDDINCICPSDNESEDSDIERGCGRPNCIYKSRNADKNAAIGNIFKNNAVRCEKPEAKEPEEPRPDMDQLFDSLFETKPTSNERKAELTSIQNALASKQIDRSFSTDSPTKTDKEENLRQFTVSELSLRPENKKLSSKDGSDSASSITQQDPTYLSKPLIKTKKSEHFSLKGDIFASTLGDETVSKNENSNSIQISANVGEANDKDELRLGVQGSCQIHSDVVHETSSKGAKTQDSFNKEVILKAVTNRPQDSDNNFDTNKQESFNKLNMLSKLCTEKMSDLADTGTKRIYNSDLELDNESAASKYLRGLSPSEAAGLEIYTMVTAQGTQTVNLERHDKSKYDDFTQSKIDEQMDMLTVPKTRIRLQKYDVRDSSHKSKSSKSIQTEINTGSKVSESTESDDDDPIISKTRARHLKERGSIEGYNKAVEIKALQDVDSFTPPTSKPAEKNSPRKSDEGISTSYDYSVDALDHAHFDETGVAPQRARRKCTVGKQNILAEHWSSESEFDGVPPRPNSADSVVASASRKKKSKKKEGHHSVGRRGSRHASKNESRVCVKGHGGGDGVLSEESDAGGHTGKTRAPPGPKMRARPAHHYWSSDGEETIDPQPQHGWIVGDSHKKLVTMLAHAKGRKRTTVDKRHYFD